MPRLNAGTLLENIVVLEGVRLAFDEVAPDQGVAFATSFAMPPLTQCWSRPNEVSTPPFNHQVLVGQAAQKSHPAQSLQALWALCTNNAPGIEFQRFQDFRPGKDQMIFSSPGPNGALLASMLAAQRGCEINVWANDKGDRYGQRSTTSPNTIRQSALLTGRDAHGSATEIGGEFPGTIPYLSDWLATGAARLSTLRIGFLDPDNYMQGDAQVSANDHAHWLRALAMGGSAAISVLFSGCQDHGPGNQKRNARLAHFHHDALDLYPRSYVFESGTFQTGVKFSWPVENIDRIAANLRKRIEASWHDWCGRRRQLRTHVDGIPSR
jgi:hypothetical protein